MGRRFLSWLVAEGQKFILPVFLIALAAIFGILIAEWLPGISLWVWLAAAMLALAASWKWRGRGDWMFLLATAAIFGFHYAVANYDPLRNSLMAYGDAATTVVVEGVIDTAVEVDPHTPHGWKFGVKARQVNHQPWSRTRLWVQYRSLNPPEYGDFIQATGLARATMPIRNPGEFDYANYMRHESYSGELRVSQAESLQVLRKNAGSSLYAAALRAREWLGKTVTLGIVDDPMVAATIRAMVLGTQESTPEEVENAFINSGTMHVFAVSGLHVVLFGWVLWQFLKPLQLPRGWMLGLIFPLMFFFVFITGLRASAWRAAIMACLMLSAPLLRRRSDLFNSLGASALALLMVDPHECFQPGFQLSFGVLFSLAILSKFFAKPMEKWHQPDPFMPRQLLTKTQNFYHYLAKKISECVAISLASTLGSAPLMIAHFHLLTPIGVISNLFLVFLSMAILFTACVSILTGLVSFSWLTILANHTNYALAITSVKLATFFSSIPFGHFLVNSHLWKPGETARLCVLDLPNGGSAHSWLEPKTAWLLDCGSSNTWSRTVHPHLLDAHALVLDGAFLSHRDASHNGASGDVRKDFNPPRVYTGPRESPKTRLVKTDRAVFAGFRINISEKSELEVLYPHENSPFGLADDRCSALLLHHRNWRILFMFDCGFLAEKWLLEHHPGLRADVLIKGQSAHDLSGLAEFINMVQPRTIISTHADFPLEERISPEWKKMVQEKGIMLFDQGQTGAVSLNFEGDGERLHIKSFLTPQNQILQVKKNPYDPPSPAK